MAKFTEPKYRTLHEAEENELDALRDKLQASKWKPSFHIFPSSGLLNDPNGLAYFNGAFHVFYQWYPFGAIHGMKHWAHVKSVDLVNWERQPVALVPEEAYESHGAYSGASLEMNDELYLYYTGNIKYSPKSEDRSATQCLAIMDKQGNIRKYEQNPIIDGVPEGYTGHVRDPKVFKKNDHYYMLLGAQRTDLTGTILVYESTDALNWGLKGELKLDLDLPASCYMLECPDYFEINGQGVLVVSPQGLDAGEHAYQNLFNVIYAVGTLDIENLEYQVINYQEVDKGFDFYAPQTFNGKHDERLLFGWAGMGETDYPTDEEGWAHSLTIPRELSIVNNTLLQKPANALKQLRKQSCPGEVTVDTDSVHLSSTSNQYEMEMTIDCKASESFGLELFSSETEGLLLEFNRSTQSVTLNRERFDAELRSEHGFTRSAKLEWENTVKIQAIIDHSIAEIFINDGETVFTTRVFPKKESTGIKLFSKQKVTASYRIHELKNGSL
ncbi:glycoside hydrolase family 32 protein [Bacillus sp. KH172YL63]|uniref:glycoside hydrolase family 32 protein n=1 Tax=Bacillus sp. KH172YL63 TaxID=2709784 RepID=UPI0013E4BF37|nr:sucrose-6-phosphate hydrolase [Bacillus sp. KH172YL63]BCB05843.1 invertase [Bacillus sp. KH172YL63]